jgi:hypothetical protein
MRPVLLAAGLRRLALVTTTARSQRHVDAHAASTCAVLAIAPRAAVLPTLLAEEQALARSPDSNVVGRKPPSHPDPTAFPAAGAPDNKGHSEDCMTTRSKQRGEWVVMQAEGSRGL